MQCLAAEIPEVGRTMAEIVEWSHAQAGEVIDRAVAVLRYGGRVAFPTDTFYEVGASGLEENAVRGLPEGPTPVTVALGSAEEILEWVPDLSPVGVRIAKRCWPGPVTLVGTPTAGRGHARALPAGTQKRLGENLAFRSPAHRVVLEVQRRLGGPLLLAPTNVFSPETAEVDIRVSLDLVIQDGPTYFRKPPTVVHVEGSNWRVVSEGPVTERDLAGLLPVHILFVCTGNTCRSPLAEVLCRRLLADRLGCAVDALRARSYVVESAGLAASAGGDAAPDAVAVASEYSVDLAGHRSRFLTEDILARADFLFTMTRNHLLTLASANIPGMPEPRLLSSRGDDIPDPIGSDLETYRVCARTIWDNLQEWLPELQAAANFSM